MPTATHHEEEEPEAIESPLQPQHLEAGAKFAPFAGWRMPIQYTGIAKEHHIVRERAGVFDISHMGKFSIQGKDSVNQLNRLLSHDLEELSPGLGHYTLLLNEAGGILDDLFAYRLSHDDFFLIVNASRTQTDEAWLRAHLKEASVTFIDQSRQLGALALQGPSSRTHWENLGTEWPFPQRNQWIGMGNQTAIMGTGYTGEEGLELVAPLDEIGLWWQRLIDAGVEPCGLGARDTLRLEKAYPLYGSDLDESTNPWEAGLGFAVRLGKQGGFIGAHALTAAKDAGLSRKLSAIRAVGKCPPFRAGYEVQTESGTTVAHLTSGTLSPSAGESIGLAYLPSDCCRPGTTLSLLIRGASYAAKVVKKPFI